MVQVNLPSFTGDSSEDQWRYEVTQAVNSAGTGDGNIQQDPDSGMITSDGLLLGYLYRYLDVAYATDSNGANFSQAIASLPAGTTPVWQGLRNTMNNLPSSRPADFTWVQINSTTTSDTLRASYRTVGGRQLDWNFGTTIPSGYTEDNSGVLIDLESLPGAAGTDGNSVGVKTLYRRSDTVVTETPVGGTFTTSTGAFAMLPSGWSEAIPPGSVGTVYATTANIFGNGVINLVWSPPVAYAQLGAEDGFSNRSDVAYATVLENPIQEIQTVVLSDPEVISGAVRRANEVQALNYVAGTRSNLVNPEGASDEIIRIGFETDTDFGIEQQSETFTFTNFGTVNADFGSGNNTNRYSWPSDSPSISDNRWSYFTSSPTFATSNGIVDGILTWNGSNSLIIKRGLLPTSPNTTFTVEIEVLTLPTDGGFDPSVFIVLPGGGLAFLLTPTNNVGNPLSEITATGVYTFRSEIDSFGLDRQINPGESIRLFVFNSNSGSGETDTSFQYRINSFSFQTPQTESASYTFELDADGDHFPLVREPSNSITDFWGRADFTNSVSAAADGTTPSGNTYWSTGTSGSTILWQGASVTTSNLGNSTSFRVGDTVYYRGAVFSTITGGLAYTIRRELPLSISGTFTTGTTASEAVVQVADNIISNYSGTSRTQNIASRPAQSGSIEIDFTAARARDGGNAQEIVYSNAFAPLTQIAVNFARVSSLTGEQLATEVFNDLVGRVASPFTISRNGAVITLTAPEELTFAYGARTSHSFFGSRWERTPEIRVISPNMMVQFASRTLTSSGFLTGDQVDVGTGPIVTLDIDSNASTNLVQLFTVTQNSAPSSIRPYIEVLQEGSQANLETASVYTLRDYSNSVISVFTSSVTSPTASDVESVASRAAGFITSNTETPINFEAQVETDMNRVLATGVTPGNVTGLFSLNANHGISGSGTIQSFTPQLIVEGSNESDSSAPTLRFHPPTGAVRDLLLFDDSTVSQTRDKFQIAEYIRDNFTYDGWTISGTGDQVVFTAAAGGDVTGQWDVTVLNLGTSGTTMTQINDLDFSTIETQRGQAVFSNLQFPTGRYADSNYSPAVAQPDNNYRGERIVSWVRAANEPVVSTNVNDYNFIRTVLDAEAPIGVRVDSSRGTAFRNNTGMTELTATVTVDNEDSTDAQHTTYNYRWEHNGNVVCVDTNRNVLDSSGNPMTATINSDGNLVCMIGVPADSEVTTTLGSSLRSINVGAEDVTRSAQFTCEVSNI